MRGEFHRLSYTWGAPGMPSLDLTHNYFELFDLPVSFDLDAAQLRVHYRQLQSELHPDRYAAASAGEQRLAVQYSARVNEAYNTLREPVARALYLLFLAGRSQDEINREQVDGGFLIMQMELREKLESIDELVDPETAIDNLLQEIAQDMGELQGDFASAYSVGDLDKAGAACVKLQYLQKLAREAEIKEADLMDRAG